MRSIVFVLSLFAASAAYASTVRHAELKDRVNGSHIVARAHVSFVDDRAGESEGKFRTRIGFEIDEEVKGLNGAATYELVLRGGKSGPYQMYIPGMPSFQPGDEVVLLVTHTAGGDAISGLGEGVFTVSRKTSVPKVAQPFIGASHVIDAQGRELRSAAIETTLSDLMTQLHAYARGAQ